MDIELQKKIFQEVQEERQYQEKRWKGQMNTQEQWENLCAEYALAESDRAAGRGFYERMIKVAALAFAALEAAKTT